jgi:hypothetical protein
VLLCAMRKMLDFIIKRLLYLGEFNPNSTNIIGFNDSE